MITGLQQQPVVDRSVQSLINLWNAGLVACRTTMMYAVECAMTRDEFLHVARSQVPLIDLIVDEFKAFAKYGWSVIPNTNGDPLDQTDKDRLSSFRHNAINPEGFFSSLVEFSMRDQDHFEEWYQASQAVYRRRPTLGPMIRGACLSLHPFASMEQVRLMPNVESDRLFRDKLFNPARVLFSNVITNAIKFNNPGGRVIIKNDGLRVLFKDNGIGMSPKTVSRLLYGSGNFREEKRVGHIPGTGHGWVTIRETARNLGWSTIIDSVVDRGTSVEFLLNDANFYRADKAITSTFVIVDGSVLIGAADVVEGARVYTGMKPFEGYSVTPSGKLLISPTAIYRATEQASGLVDLLYMARGNPPRNSFS